MSKKTIGLLILFLGALLIPTYTKKHDNHSDVKERSDEL